MPTTKGLRAWLVPMVAVICALYIVVRTASFVHIFGQHAGIVLTQVEILEAYESRQPFSHDTAYVPRIIHQIFHNWTDPENEALPIEWSKNRRSCIDLNPGWESWVNLHSVAPSAAARLTIVALDTQNLARLYRARIPMVLINIRQFRIPHPTDRQSSILPPSPLWRHLHGRRQWL